MPEQETPVVEPVAHALPALRRVVATDEIPRTTGIPLVAGQAAWLPIEDADAAIAAGKAIDPDAEQKPVKKAAAKPAEA